MKEPVTFLITVGFSETLTRKQSFDVFGNSEIETMGGFIETRVSTDEEVASSPADNLVLTKLTLVFKY